jgi:hypothetical protein
MRYTETGQEVETQEEYIETVFEEVMCYGDDGHFTRWRTAEERQELLLRVVKGLVLQQQLSTPELGALFGVDIEDEM